MYKPLVIIFTLLFITAASAQQKYLNLQFQDARHSVTVILKKMQSKRDLPTNSQVQILTEFFSDKLYKDNATGEGDWLPTSSIYHPGGKHLQPSPMYRTDVFDCVSYVQMLLALLNANDIDSFDQTWISIAYKDHKTHMRWVTFANRNHFIDADWNANNENIGFLKDVTANGNLAVYAKIISANINYHNYLAHKTISLDSASREKFKADLQILNSNKRIYMVYLPKEILPKISAQIPTPAVVEIVRDPKRWTIDKVPVEFSIGSETSISHMGILFRQQFKQGEFIYNRITCLHNVCKPKPIYCRKKICRELMFTHATNSYTSGCNHDQQVCKKQKNYNRIEHIPFLNYLMDARDGNYTYMQDASIIGIHIEKILR